MATVQSTLRYSIFLFFIFLSFVFLIQQDDSAVLFVTGPGAAGDILPYRGGTEGG